MDNLPKKTNYIIDSIRDTCKSLGLRAYLFGDLVRSSLTNVPFTTNYINCIISGDFDVKSFYKSISSRLTINREIVNSNNYYVVVSRPYILSFKLFKHFTPGDISLATQFADFTIDAITFDLSSGKVYHVGSSQEDLTTLTIKCFETGKWQARQLFGYARKYADIDNVKIDDHDIKKMSQIRLRDIQPTPNTTLLDMTKELLLSRQPGKAIKFVTDNTTDGRMWLTEQLIEIMLSFSIPVSEDITPSEILSPKKLQLVDVYNEFYLYEKSAELPEERKHRLETTLRLLFDSPAIRIETPYIDSVSVITAPSDEPAIIADIPSTDDGTANAPDELLPLAKPAPHETSDTPIKLPIPEIKTVLDSKPAMMLMSLSTVSVGTPDTGSSIEDESAFVGNWFLASTDTYIKEIRVSMNITDTSQKLFFYVLKQASVTSSKYVAQAVAIDTASSADAGSSAGIYNWYSSGSINVEILSGAFYIIGVAVEGPSGAAIDAAKFDISSAVAIDTAMPGLGTFKGNMSRCVFPPMTSITLSGGDSGAVTMEIDVDPADDGGGVFTDIHTLSDELTIHQIGGTSSTLTTDFSFHGNAVHIDDGGAFVNRNTYRVITQFQQQLAIDVSLSNVVLHFMILENSGSNNSGQYRPIFYKEVTVASPSGSPTWYSTGSINVRLPDPATGSWYIFGVGVDSTAAPDGVTFYKKSHSWQVGDGTAPISFFGFSAWEVRSVNQIPPNLNEGLVSGETAHQSGIFSQRITFAENTSPETSLDLEPYTTGCANTRVCDPNSAVTGSITTGAIVNAATLSNRRITEIKARLNIPSHSNDLTLYWYILKQGNPGSYLPAFETTTILTAGTDGDNIYSSGPITYETTESSNWYMFGVAWDGTKTNWPGSNQITFYKDSFTAASGDYISGSWAQVTSSGSVTSHRLQGGRSITKSPPYTGTVLAVDSWSGQGWLSNVNDIQFCSEVITGQESNYGACCLQGGVCVYTDEPDCRRRLGSFKGIGVPCTGDLCDETPPGDCYVPPCNCDPTSCGEKDGNACCCCSSYDIISATRVSCHRRIVVSCDNTGTKPGPGLDAFPVTCPKCYEACEAVLGTHPTWDFCNNLNFPSWWIVDPLTPCECYDVSVNQANDLHCATCLGDDTFCNSSVEVGGNDCAYEFSLKPSSGCCGSPALVDWMFVIDYSGSMGNKIEEVKNQVLALVDALEQTGAIARIGLTQFGDEPSRGDPKITIPFTDPASFQSRMPVGTRGGYELDFEAVYVALTQGAWGSGVSSYIMLIADELSYGGYANAGDVWWCEDHPGELPPYRQAPTNRKCGDTNQQCFDNVVQICHDKGISVIVVDTTLGGSYQPELLPDGTPNPSFISNCGDPARLALANATGGARFSFDKQFADILNELDITIFPTSCDCLDNTPLRLRRDPFNYPECDCPNDPTGLTCVGSIPEWCYQFPIKKRLAGTDVDASQCDEPFLINSCGNTIVVTPTDVLEACCGSLVLDNGQSLGCECPPESNVGCCGPECINICKPDGNGSFFATLSDAQIAVWEHCQDQQSYADDDNPECLWFSDGTGSFVKKCKSQVDAETSTVFTSCFVEEPGVEWTCSDARCDLDDELIAGSGSCNSLRHPSVVVLNNAVGLVAYETSTNSAGANISQIKLAQFNTSARHKLLPNRKFNYGRLQHQRLWTNNQAKLYVYDPVPVALLQGSNQIDIQDPDTWVDVIAFENGPLQGQCFPLGQPAYGNDANGQYILFTTQENAILSNPFPSSDDVYNVRWFVYDLQSENHVIGDAINTTSGTTQTYPHAEFLFSSRSEVDARLRDMPPHVYNGKQVPMAYPQLATAYNYSNELENSHHVYLVYQALEDEKWNVYLRQIRLSEYDKKRQTDQGSLSTLESLGTTELLYHVVCTSDSCTEVQGDRFLIERTVVFDLTLTNGLDVLNPSFSSGQFWSALCPGYPANQFPKNKVFAKLTHSVIADRCPDQFDRNDIFYNWQAGQVFNVPISVNSPQSLFTVVKISGDDAVSLGQFQDDPITQGGAVITASTVGGAWYDSLADSDWSVLSDAGSDPSDADVIMDFKGMDIGEPILISIEEHGHATRPVVKVSYANEVYIAYESTETGVPQIKIIGTKEPVDVLPVGIHSRRVLDTSLNYFLQNQDFVYSADITSLGEGLNQSPDMYIDFNDVIHLTWQSNKDGRWEIYYANSSDGFVHQRITNYVGKSLQPKISGAEIGNLYITWHDNRFGNYEIMLAYKKADRIVPLYEQDPYLASLRNTNQGWSHVLDEIPLTLTNLTGATACFNDIQVNFYADRLLDNKSFTITSKQFPYAFTLPDAQNDTGVVELHDFNQWTTVASFQTDPYVLETILATSPEVDTFIEGSDFGSFTLPSLSGDCNLVSIAFRSSDTKNDSQADTQWSTAVDISGKEGQTVALAALGLGQILGRYKQVRIEFVCLGQTEIFTIDDGADDADLANGLVWTNDQSIVRFGQDAASGSDEYDAFLRFNLAIPKDSIIVGADLRLKASSTATGDISTQICLLPGNSSSFESTSATEFSVPNNASDAYMMNGLVQSDSTTSTTLRFGASGGNNYETWLRFPLNIPKGSIITNAYVEFESITSSSGNTDVIISLLDGLDIDPFSSSVGSSIFSSAGTAGGSVLTYLSNGHSVKTFPIISGLLDISNTISGPPLSLESTQKHLFARWDLSAIPSQATITNAQIELFEVTQLGTPNSGIIIATPTIIAGGTNCPAFLANQWPNGYPLQITTAGAVTPTSSLLWTGITADNNVLTSDISTLIQQWVNAGGTTYFGVVLIFNGSSTVPYNIDTATTILNVDYAHTDFPNLTTSSVHWQETASYASGSRYRTPDISTLVTDWLSSQNDGYTGGNYVGFRFADVASNVLRTIAAFDAGSGTEAVLHVQVDTPVSSCRTDIAAVSWSPDDWTAGSFYNTPEIKTLVQAYIDDPSYDPLENPATQYIGLAIQNNDSDSVREFTAYDAAYGTDGAELSVGYIEPFVWDFSIEFISPLRICLRPGESVEGQLDLNPLIRADNLGAQMAESPIPVDYVKNMTYFIDVIGINDIDNELVPFEKQRLSVSCGSCSKKSATWDYTSCSMHIQIPNTTGLDLFYNVRLRFYADENLQSAVTEMWTEDISDLAYFTVNQQPAENAWTPLGVPVQKDRRLDLFAWPQMSITEGILCGVSYYVQIEYCAIQGADQRCPVDGYQLFGIRKWTCGCDSVRWDPRFETAPVNLLEMSRWVSSGSGFSDTRITESDADNLNPTVKMRDNLNGIIVYSSNRVDILDDVIDPNDRDYKIFASVFSVKPAFNMYASATEVINSPFDQIIHRSDIAICENNGCYERDDNGDFTKNPQGQFTKANDTLEGHLPSIDIDQYDNLFMAIEKPFNDPSIQSECSAFEPNKQKKIVVHRCGVNGRDLDFLLFKKPEEEKECNPTSILNNLYVESDPVFAQTVRKIRVRNEFVAYHVTRNAVVSPVVNKCSIGFEIVGTTETVAVRLRNGSSLSWSEWIAFSPDIGENTMNVDWNLTVGSGVKTVQFQVATYAGLSGDGSITIIADYTRINYEVKFYRWPDGPFPPDSVTDDFYQNGDIWQDSNMLSDMNGVPVASIRNSDVADPIVSRSSDYIYVEIIPEVAYMRQFSAITPDEKENPTITNSCITPTFDFMNQGGFDNFGIQTKWAVNSEGKEVFRGYIRIEREAQGVFKDGLASIVPHFKNDCSDSESVSTICSEVEQTFTRDKYNVTAISKQQSTADDVWKAERDGLGRIENAVVIRPLEDPYFIFGDPNYRLHRDE